MKVSKRVAAFTAGAALVAAGVFGGVNAASADTTTPDPIASSVATPVVSPSPDPTQTSNAPAPTDTQQVATVPTETTPAQEPAPADTTTPSDDSTKPVVQAQAKTNVGNDPPKVKACTPGDASNVTWTRDAHLSTATVTLKPQFTTCDVTLHAFPTEGPTWETSGTQTFGDYAGFTLTKENPTKTLTVVPSGCFQQQDLATGSLTKYDGQVAPGHGPVPHYPNVSTPTGLIDHWNGAVDCTPPPPKAAVCTATGSYLVTNLNEQGFNYSPTGSPYADTRAKGHYEYVSGALHLYTDDNSTLAKVQAARAVSIPVKQYGGAFSITQTLTSGTIKVGINVRFTDGTQTFTATAEPGTPGYNQLWSNASGWLPYTATGGSNNGQGGPYSGTIDDIVASHPNATVSVEALSDGSGVYNNALVSSWSTPCNSYTYNYVKPSTPVEGTPIITVDGPTCKALYNTINYNIPSGLSVNGFTGTGSIRAEDYPDARGDGSSIYGHWNVPVVVEDGYSYDGPSSLQFDLVDPTTLDCNVPTMHPENVMFHDSCGVTDDSTNVPGSLDGPATVVNDSPNAGDTTTLSSYSSEQGGYYVKDVVTAAGVHTSEVTFVQIGEATIADPGPDDTYKIVVIDGHRYAQWTYTFDSTPCPTPTPTPTPTPIMTHPVTPAGNGGAATGASGSQPGASSTVASSFMPSGWGIGAILAAFAAAIALIVVVTRKRGNGGTSVE